MVTKLDFNDKRHIHDIKRQILLPAGLLVLVLLVIFFYTLYSMEMRNNNQKMTNVVNLTEKSFLRKVDEKAFYLASQMHFFNDNSCLASALADKDFEKLQKCSRGIKEPLQHSFDLKKISYIALDNSYSFQVLSQDAQTIISSNTKKLSFISKKSINTEQSAYGIELSDSCSLSLTMTFPMVYDYKIISYVEIVTGVMDILYFIEDAHDFSLFIFIQKKCFNDKSNQASSLEEYSELEIPPWDYLENNVLLYGDEDLLNEEQKIYFDQISGYQIKEWLHFEREGFYSSVGYFPLLDSNGNSIGHIGLISDNTVHMMVIFKMLFRFIVIYLLCFIVLFFVFYRYIHKLEYHLKSYYKALKDEIVVRQKTEASLKQLKSAVEHTGSVVMVTDRSGMFEYVNPRFTEVTGYSNDEIMGKTPAILNTPREDKVMIKNLWDTILSGKRWVGDILNKRKNNELYWGRLSISPIFNEKNIITSFVGVSEDITELKKAHETMSNLALYDTLTGLPNRRLFMDRIKQMLVTNSRNKTTAAVFFLDLDKFKQINDTLGHDAGDELLVEVAKRIQSLLRKTDTIARMGGDEFTLILADVKEKKIVEVLANKIIKCIAEPMELMGKIINVTASVGITITPSDGDTVNQLLKNADIAMYKSKESGKNKYCFYQKENG